MKIGDRVFVRGYIDEIRKDTVIIRNAGGYFGTIPSEVITGELPSAQPQRKKGKWIPVTRIEEWHEEEGLVGFPPEVKEFPQCTIKWVDATEPDEVDGLRCSECGTVYDFTEARNWCSECGADMRTPVETARDIVHKAIDNSVWSDTVDAAEMHKVIDDKYAEIRGDTNVDANT